MSVTQQKTCPTCQALANPAWSVCAVCQAPLCMPDWNKAWRDLAEVTYGIPVNDPRYERVMRWLDVADTAFALGSWPNFQEAATMLKEVAKEKS